MAADPTCKASDLFVRALVAEGVERVFAVPGEENLDLLESLRTSWIEVVVNRHEQGAAFMAATYGRLTCRAGVALATAMRGESPHTRTSPSSAAGSRS